MINSLVEKDIVSLEEIRNQVSKLDSEEQEEGEQRIKCALVIGHHQGPSTLNSAYMNLVLMKDWQEHSPQP